MYRITHLKLHNICQHRSLDADISAGLTAIVAPNGYGKTNLCRALMYGLTGIVDGTWGNQQTLQSDGSSTPGYVEVSFTDGSSDYVIRRYSTSSIKFPDSVSKDGAVVYIKRKTVDSFMQTVFGMPCSMMFQLAWARQGELSQLLTAPKAVVSSFLSTVFDTTCMERLRDALKAASDTVLDLSPGVFTALENSRKALAELPATADIETVMQSYKDKFADLTARCAKIEDQLRGAFLRKYVLDSLLEYRKQRKAVMKTLMTLLDISVPNVGIDALKSEETDLKAELESARKELHQCSAVLSFARSQVEVHKTKLGVLVKDDKCALCGHVIDDMDAYKENMLTMLGMATNAELDAKIAEAKDNSDRLEHVLTTIEAKIELKTMQIAKLKALEELSAINARIKDTLKMKVVSDSDVEKLNKLKQTLNRINSGLTDLTVQLEVVKTKRESLLQQIEQEEAMTKQYTTNKDVKDVLAELRSIFSRDRAQAAFVYARIQRLNVELDKYMQLTQMPFTLRLDPASYSFVFVTHDGYTHPSVHLSGAQKSMSAVALQMALYTVAMPNMNLYVIDEPTEALDEYNKTIMAEMFARMNTLLPSVGGTMLIVTRDQQTISNCGNTLDLEELSNGTDDSDAE